MDVNLLTAKDFIGVRAALIRELGGDANRAVVLTRIFYRASEDFRGAIERDGLYWWRATREEIAEETGLSPDQIKRIMTWLVDQGYVESVAHHLEGKWDQTRSLRVPVDQADSTHARADSPDIGADSHRWIGAESPDPIGAESPNPPIKTPKTVKTLDGPKTSSEIDHAFGIFWEIYPRHIAKAKARIAFEKAVQKERAAVIVEGARAYRRSVGDSDPKFIAHPTTWLNAERWTDELGPVAGTGRDSIRSL